MLLKVFHQHPFFTNILHQHYYSLFFISPVLMTECGHNFCQQCLTGTTETPWMCPECKTEHHERPEQLSRNYFLEKTVKKFIASREKICAAHNWILDQNIGLRGVAPFESPFKFKMIYIPS